MSSKFVPSESYFGVKIKKTEASEHEDIISIIFHGCHGFLDFLKHLESRFDNHNLSRDPKFSMHAESPIKDCDATCFLLQRKPGETNNTVTECMIFIKSKMKSVCALSRIKILEALRENVSFYIAGDNFTSLEDNLQKTQHWSYSFGPNEVTHRANNLTQITRQLQTINKNVEQLKSNRSTRSNRPSRSNRSTRSTRKHSRKNSRSNARKPTKRRI